MKKFVSLVLVITILSSLLLILPTSAAYENTHTNTGNQIEDLIAVAATQIGYKEGNSSSQLSGTVAGSGNYTKYGAWYGINPGAWCAMFVSWCANQAGISSSIIPKHASCDIGMNYFKNQGTWGWGKYWGNYKGYTVYTPKRGDIIYFGNGNLNDSTHVGIVYKVDSSYVYTIEGNTKGVCAYRSYSLNDDYIYGYGKPTYTGDSGSGSGTTTVASSMSISNATYPTALTVGSSFNLEGVISSSCSLTWVRGAVYNSSGAIVLSSVNTPNTTSYDINTAIDSSIKFGTLAAGTYVYCIEAKDSNGTYEMLLMQPFTVGSSTQTQTTFPYTVTTSGGTLNIRSGAGTSYSVVGTLINGTELSVQKILNDWAYITHGGVSGWVSMSYLTIDYSPDGTGSSTSSNFSESAVIDINYSDKTTSDSFGVLSFARSITPSYVTNMSAYGSGETAVNVTAAGTSFKYTGNVTLGTQFAIELYGVFNAGEVLNTCYYPIEVSSDGKISTWYLPTGTDSSITSSSSYDLSKAHHIMVVGNTSTFSLYVDGKLAASRNISITSTQLAGDAIYIGGNGMAASHLIRFRVFDSAPAASDVAEVYASYVKASASFSDSEIIDINYSDKTTADTHGILTFDRDITPSYVTDMSAYDSGETAVNLSASDENFKYTGNTTLGTKFAIELYGVFRAGEVLNNCYYPIEVNSDGTIGTWYLPTGADSYVCSTTSYDLSKAHHIMVVGNSTKLSLYIDGTLAASKSITLEATPLAGEQIYIGGNGMAASHLIRFRVFSTAPTSTQVASVYSEYEVVNVDPFELSASSAYSFSDSYLKGITESTTVDTFLSAFVNKNLLSVTKNGSTITGTTVVGTGCVVTDGSKSYTLVQAGDINGDGLIKSTDYLLVKREFSGSSLTGAKALASDVDGNGSVTASDYLKVKRHVTGSYSLY